MAERRWRITKGPPGRYDGVDDALPSELRIDGPDTETVDVVEVASVRGPLTRIIGACRSDRDLMKLPGVTGMILDCAEEALAAVSDSTPSQQPRPAADALGTPSNVTSDRTGPTPSQGLVEQIAGLCEEAAEGVDASIPRTRYREGKAAGFRGAAQLARDLRTRASETGLSEGAAGKRGVEPLDSPLAESDPTPPERCPTCGSDDPALGYYEDETELRAPCPDPFHGSREET